MDFWIEECKIVWCERRFDERGV